MVFSRSLTDTLEIERNFHQTRIAACGTLQTIGDSVFHEMAVLDAKSATLLEFISIVIAALTFSLGVVDGASPYAVYVKAAIFVFIGVFGLAAWIDLRCLSAISPTINRQDKDELEKTLLIEICKRRGRYNFSLAIAKTAFVLLMFAVVVWNLLIVTRLFVD